MNAIHVTLELYQRQPSPNREILARFAARDLDDASAQLRALALGIPLGTSLTLTLRATTNEGELKREEGLSSRALRRSAFCLRTLLKSRVDYQLTNDDPWSIHWRELYPEKVRELHQWMQLTQRCTSEARAEASNPCAGLLLN